MPAKRDRMARVQVDDDVWREFRALAGYRPISEAMLPAPPVGVAR